MASAGMGRTGAWYGFQHYDLQPDIVALGKGLGNGYPVSAVAMSRDVAARLQADLTFRIAGGIVWFVTQGTNAWG